MSKDKPNLTKLRVGYLLIWIDHTVNIVLFLFYDYKLMNEYLNQGNKGISIKRVCSLGQEVVNFPNKTGQLLFNLVHLLSASALKLNIFYDLTHIMRLRGLGFLCEVTHFELPGLLVYPHETLFELIL